MSDREQPPTMPSPPTVQAGFRSGFGCLVGRPNAGKSTLTNAMVGQKVAIASSRPQTTRHAVRGIVHRDDGQLIVIDTPGLHKPRTLLGERLNTVVLDTWSEVDVVGLCFASDQKIGPGDEFLMREAAGTRAPKFAVATKGDIVSRDRMAQHLQGIVDTGRKVGVEFAEVVPVSAVSGDGVALLASLMLKQLPEGPPLYPDGELTDEPDRVLVAELVREAALEGVRDELPHSIAVEVTEMVPREDRPADKPFIDVYVTIYVERSSQKAIVVGKGGLRLRDVGTNARGSIEALLGARVFLNLHVTVLADWQRNPKHLCRLGF